MHRHTAISGGKFNPANQLQPGSLGVRNRGIVPREGVVIGNRERLEADARPASAINSSGSKVPSE